MNRFVLALSGEIRTESSVSQKKESFRDKATRVHISFLVDTEAERSAKLSPSRRLAAIATITTQKVGREGNDERSH
jgi:hypothetical protein